MAKKTLFAAACLAAFVLLLAAPAARGEILRLKDGSFLQGKIVESDKKFVVFKRWDTGGVVKLSWQQLVEKDRLRLGLMLGLIVSEDQRAIKVDGVRLHLKTGETLEGVVVKDQSTSTEIALLTSPGKPFKYPRTIIRSEEPIQIEILRVYTEQEAYDQRIAAQGDPATFEAHMTTADYCQRIGFYEKEKEHLEKARDLGPPDKSQEEFIANRLDTLVELIKEKEVLVRIKAINRLIANKKFGEAAAAWKTVQDEFTESKIVVEDREKVAERIEREKENYLRAVVVRGWFAQLRTMVQAKVRDKELSLSDAKKWAQRELSRDILAKLTEIHGIEESDIKDTFDARKTYVYRKAHYGPGTFIVQKSSGSSSSSGSSIVDQLGEKMGLGKDAREKVKEAFGFKSSSKKKTQKTLTPDEWWAKASTSTKAHWLTAYYAENSGDIEVVRIDYQPCTECGGKGYKKYIAAGSDKEGTKYESCRRCHGLGKYRTVVYK